MMKVAAALALVTTATAIPQVDKQEVLASFDSDKACAPFFHPCHRPSLRSLSLHN